VLDHHRQGHAPGPGRLRAGRLYLVVEDLPAALNDLQGRGIDVSEPFHFGPDGQAPGLDPQRQPYGSFATFADPDGNTWLMQEIP